MATKFLNVSTDSTLGGNSPSDEIVASQKAIKDYVDSQTGQAPAFANITGSPDDNTALKNALDNKVAKSGDTMTGTLEFLSTPNTSPYIRFSSSLSNKVAMMYDSWYSLKIFFEGVPTDGIEINTSIPLIAPITNNTGRVGDSSRKWASIYSTAVYTTKINNGADITVPTTGGTMALTSDIPTVPTVNNPTITITQGGVTKGSFTLNQASGDTIALDAGGGGSLPDQTGHAGEFLTTDGTNASWSDVIGYHPDLFDVKWADHQINDVQWLRGDTFSWQSGAVYQAAYQHLLDDICDLVYAWSDTVSIFYTLSENPQVGDTVYVIDDHYNLRSLSTITSISDNTITIDILGTFERNSEDDRKAITKTTQTETIAGVTITYYLTDDGHKIVPSDQENNVLTIYNNIGVAWYYILDRYNQRFKLPRTKFGFTGIRDNVGDYTAPGLPNITGEFYNKYNNTDIMFGNQSVGSGALKLKTEGTFRVCTNSSSTVANSGSLELDASESNAIYGNSDTVQPPATQMYLYFYVGSFTQTALENTAGITAETLNDKVDKGHEVIEFQAPTAGNNYTWYRKYADGWVEQGGIIFPTTSTPTRVSVTLPVIMSSNVYSVQVTVGDNTADAGIYSYYTNRTTTGFEILHSHTTSSYTIGDSWQVSGMAA